MFGQASTLGRRQKKIRVAALIRCGELCRSCGTVCRKDYENGSTLVACPVCDEVGTDGNGQLCKHCRDGQIQISECPRRYIGNEFTNAINLATMCGGGDWPVAGGLLDQSAWFLDLKQRLDNENNRIEAERNNG